jgi:hypothetical protein
MFAPCPHYESWLSEETANAMRVAAIEAIARPKSGAAAAQEVLLCRHPALSAAVIDEGVRAVLGRSDD